MIRALRVALFAVMIGSGIFAGMSGGVAMEVALTVLVLALIGEGALAERERLARWRREQDETLAYLRDLIERGADDREHGER